MVRGVVKLFITHAGIFHADDILATAIVRWIYGEGTPVARREPTSEEMADHEVVIADVGGAHVSGANNYDHHQRGGAGTRTNGVPYAAAGLLWQAVKDTFIKMWVGPDPAAVWAHVDRHLIQPVDAWDTGWVKPDPAGQPVLHLSQVVAAMNSRTATGDRDPSFWKAVRFMDGVLGAAIHTATEAVEAREAVMAAPRDGAVLVLEEFVPWQNAINKRPDVDELLYVVYPSARGGWNLQAVPKEPGSRESKRLLPEAWRGRTPEELDGMGVYGATFCHPAGFIMGARTAYMATQAGNQAAKWPEPGVLPTDAPTLDASAPTL